MGHHVRPKTTKVLQTDDHTLALGAPFGGETALLAEVGATLDKAARTHKALLDIGHAPTELVLTRQCGDVAKLSYHLRLNGDRVPDHLLQAFDQDLRVSVEHILGGSLPDSAWEQCGTGVSPGGLGLRTARQVSLAAFVASRVSARPHVREMATHLAQAGVCDMSAVMLAYDGRTEDAVVQLVATLPAAVGAALVDTLETAAEDAATVWASLFQDDEDSRGGSATGARAQHSGRPQRLGAGIVPLDEDEDVEHPAFSALPATGLHLQRVLLGYSDRHLRECMLARCDAAQDLPALRRLNDLADPECDHTWLWNLSRHRGPVLQPAQYVEAVRVRLGAAGPSEPVPCRRCGRELLDSAGSHAHCCSLGEATRGHHAVARQIFDVAVHSDPSTEIEAPGLIPGTALRPADVLTGACGHGLTALDIGIASPDAERAGADCAVTRYAEKIERYSAYTAMLDAQNVAYQPLVWTAYGRPHPRTTAILRTLANRLARRRGCSDGEWRYRRLRAAVGVEIWRRAARQVMACWPACDDDDGD